MSVPELGTYVSEDNNFKVEILSKSSSSGQIEAVYEASYSPEGPFTVEGKIGSFAWVLSNQQGKDGVAPFAIRFTAMKRPEGRPYVVLDTWAGGYQVDDTLLMEGARSYINNEGHVQVFSLGTLTFSR